MENKKIIPAENIQEQILSKICFLNKQLDEMQRSQEAIDLEYESIVKKFSNSGYIPASKEHIGRKVKVTIYKEEGGDKK